jgi:hypothetical protein
MDPLLDMLNRGVEQLLGRASGPLHFRLFVMPLVVITLAVRAGQDAKENQPAFLCAIITNPTERRRLVRSAVKDIGRISIIAVALDTTYQLVVFRAFYPVQLLIVVIACAIVPYVVIRGPVTRLWRAAYTRKANTTPP